MISVPAMKDYGKHCRERLPEFGETVLYFIPKMLRHKMDPRWRKGVFLGRPWNGDQNFVGIANGQIVRARALVRHVPDKRWNPNRLSKICVTPNTERPGNHDDLETLDAPHGNLDAREFADTDADHLLSRPSSPKMTKITWVI